MTDPIPKTVTLHRISQVLEIEFSDGLHVKLPARFLRVFSPIPPHTYLKRGRHMASYQAASGKQYLSTTPKETLKRIVAKPEDQTLGATLTTIRSARDDGLYMYFSDGRVSEVYSWNYLYQLACDHESLWQDYLRRKAHSQPFHSKSDPLA